MCILRQSYKTRLGLVKNRSTSTGLGTAAGVRHKENVVSSIEDHQNSSENRTLTPLVFPVLTLAWKQNNYLYTAFREYYNEKQ